MFDAVKTATLGYPPTPSTPDQRASCSGPSATWPSGMYDLCIRIAADNRHKTYWIEVRNSGLAVAAAAAAATWLLRPHTSPRGTVIAGAVGYLVGVLGRRMLPGRY